MNEQERIQEVLTEGRPQPFDGAEPQEFQGAGYRLSPQQRLVWQRSRAGVAHAYRAQCVVEIEGPLSAGTLKEALERLRARHEILRTSFRRRVGMGLPLQVVGEAAEGEGWWGIIETAVPPGPEQERALEELCREEAAHEFDLARGEDFRARLVEFSGGGRALVLTLPSLCADARTLDNLVRELALACDAVEGVTTPAEEVVQYAQFSEWQNELLEAEGARPRNDSPRADGARHDAQAFDPKLFSTRLGPDAVARAEALAREFECGVDVLLLACWQSLLWRLTGRPTVSVNNVFDGRVFGDLEGVAGLLAAPLPVESRFRDDSRFEEVLAQVKEAVLATRARQEHSALMPSANARGGAAEPPVEFEFNDLTRVYTTARGARLKPAWLNVCLEPFSLKLSAELRRGTLELRWFYDATRRTRREVELLAGRFARLLSGVGRGVPVSQLPVLTEEESRRLLEEWNDTRAEFPRVCMHQLFEEQAARTPEATAVNYEGERLGYAELNQRANQLAHFLRSAGVGPDVTVGVMMERTPSMVVSILGVLKAGGAYVPLDPAYPAERLRFMLEDSGISVLLTEEGLKHSLPEHAARVVSVDAQWDEIARGASDDAGVNPSTSVTPRNLAYVIYTSGSTGRPKGVMVEHAGLVNYLWWASSAYPVAEGSPVHSPLAFDLTVTSLLVPLVRGGAVELLAGGVGASRLWETLGGRSRPYGVVKLTPSHLRALRPSEGAASALVVGGEALHWGDVRGWLAAGSRVFNEYGPTEAVVGCVVYEAAPGEAAPERDEEPVPIGRPIANARIYVLDTSLAPAPEGVAGEIYIAGVGLARGYLKRPGLTAESFLPDLFAGAGARMYRTGDLGRWLEDGTLEYLGRTDSQVKVRGYRIELGEIEAALLSHPSVKDAAVLARDGEGGDKRLIAYVASNEGAAPGAQELREHLLKLLPDYMIPPQFVVLERLPLTENGKADRRALAALGEGHARGSAGAYVAPRTEVEEKLAAIWAEVLGVERVGVNDNFFDLGGDSILGVQIISRAMDAGIQLIPRQIFQHQTVAKLAETAGASDGAGDLAAELASLLPDLSAEPAGASSPDSSAEMSFDPAELEKILGKVKFGD